MKELEVIEPKKQFKSYKTVKKELISHVDVKVKRANETGTN